MTRKETVKEILINYCTTSDTAGLHLLAKKNSRVVSFFLLMSVTGYCCYQCKQNVDDYLSYAVSTRITILDNSNSTFPAITFCPQYMFKSSTFANIAYKAEGLALFYTDGTNFDRLKKEV